MSCAPSHRAFAFVFAFAFAFASPAQAEPPLRVPGPDPNMPFPPETPRIQSAPDRGFSYAEPQLYPSLAWMFFQLIPSPQLAFGRGETSFGLRWQASPVVWSWGVNRRVSRWRFFVVDPLARHSGSLELSANGEYFFGSVDRGILRPGVRAYFPLVGRGEYLSASIGTSGYVFDDTAHVAYDVGAYVLAGLFGLQATIAPEHGPLGAIATFRLRYF